MNPRKKRYEINGQIIKDAIEVITNGVAVPSSVYRFQVNLNFNFRNLFPLLPYLRQLGVGSIYLSPIFCATPGSLHGYNVTDPTNLNPELGSLDEFDALSDELKRLGMGLVIDIVPNHMGITGNNNELWQDVLENGPSSEYAHFFEINWASHQKKLKNKVLLPFLGNRYGQALENQELRLTFHEGNFYIRYHEHHFPVAPKSYARILKYGLESLERGMKKRSAELSSYQQLILEFQKLPDRNERLTERILIRRRMKALLQKKLHALYQKSSQIRYFVDSGVSLFNGEKGEPSSFNLLDQLLDEQAYVLADWHVAAEEINYKRFFNVNELAAIRMEDPRVFSHYHQLLSKWIRDGRIEGLRVDHPDGLYEPARYFEQLQHLCLREKLIHKLGLDKAGAENKERAVAKVDQILSGKEFDSAKAIHLIIEKILDRKETLPIEWRVHGTVGYDFSASLDRLFVKSKNEDAFDALYTDFIGHDIDFEELIHDKKYLFASVHMASETSAVARMLDDISERNRHYRDFTYGNFLKVIRETIACFPVYRTYIGSEDAAVSERDQKYIQIAIERAKRRTPELSADVYDFLRDILLLKLKPRLGASEEKMYREFVLRFQQITGPIMAKGLEDTAFYVQNRLISLNEVGADLKAFSVSVSDFHRQSVERATAWPYGFITTSTHDSKRSEDVRMRLHALSEMPAEWKTQIARWAVLNEKYKTEIEAVLEPRRNTEYFIYQTLLGVWPNYEMTSDQFALFKERIRNYLLKAAREAKIYTSWMNPNAVYEQALQKFIDGVLSREHNRSFFDQFLPFQKKVAELGFLTSLSALAIKLGSPGVPDFYQGNELWNYRLVDPDNRGAVDYEQRISHLQGLIRALSEHSPKQLTQELWASREDGRIKLWVLLAGLRFRKNHQKLWVGGAYFPIKVVGPKEENIIAFARQYQDEFAIVVASRFHNSLTELQDAQSRFLKGSWKETKLVLPKALTGCTKWRNIYTGDAVMPSNKGNEPTIELGQILTDLNVAILTNNLNEPLHDFGFDTLNAEGM